MKSIPMIFNTEMVQAILSGNKTVTRRPSKKEITYSKNGGFICDGYMHGIGFTHEETMRNFTSSKYAPVKVGDEIYVRETFASLDHNLTNSTHLLGKVHEVRYKASENEALGNESDWEVRGYKWSPSIHMPKWASRITLKVTDVRVERVQDITEEQSIKEGVYPAWPSSLVTPHRTSFMVLWDDIYPFTWCHNPYVWVIAFEVIKPTTESVN